jgi:hypothetical protein
VLPDGEVIEQACIDPPQSRISSATAEERNRLLIEHQVENFKARFNGSINAMLAKFGDAKEAASKLIEPDFYVKNVLQSYYDHIDCPIEPGRD